MSAPDHRDGAPAPSVRELTEHLRAAGAEVEGPVPAPDAAAAAVELTAAAPRGAVALGAGERRLEALGVPEALRAAGRDLVRPGAADHRARLAAAAVGLTGAELAVAETGSLVLAAGPGRPRLVHLLPARHVCVVELSAVRPTLADALAEIDPRSSSAWQFVSGPSRTSDLEMRPILGVHGPLSLAVLLVG